jgi:biotin synthase
MATQAVSMGRKQGVSTLPAGCVQPGQVVQTGRTQFRTGAGRAATEPAMIREQQGPQGKLKIVNHIKAPWLTGCGIIAIVAGQIHLYPVESMQEQNACLSEAADTAVRHDWSRAEVETLFNLPFNDLLFSAQTVHRANFDPNAVQISTLLSIKTGGCPEDCSYCPQSVHHDTGLEPEAVMDVADVVAAARSAKQAGATRFCMGAAWRNPKGRNFERVLDMVQRVRAEGLETCATLGMLDAAQAQALQQAGLDYYNHNLDTSPEFYGEIISTRTYEDRLETLTHVREAGINVCCGGIVGLGEQRADRVSMLCELANLPEHPGSVPINQLVRVEGTPLEQQPGIDPLEFVRTIAVARILMPHSHVRLSAGRSAMTDEMQALCFLAGANSIFYGEKLLTTGNPDTAGDDALFAKLGLHPSA